jgi:hypothetical protein
MGLINDEEQENIGLINDKEQANLILSSSKDRSIVGHSRELISSSIAFIRP